MLAREGWPQLDGRAWRGGVGWRGGRQRRGGQRGGRGVGWRGGGRRRQADVRQHYPAVTLHEAPAPRWLARRHMHGEPVHVLEMVLLVSPMHINEAEGQLTTAPECVPGAAPRSTYIAESPQPRPQALAWRALGGRYHLQALTYF